MARRCFGPDAHVGETVLAPGSEEHQSELQLWRFRGRTEGPRSLYLRATGSAAHRDRYSQGTHADLQTAGEGPEQWQLAAREPTRPSIRYAVRQRCGY